MGAKAGNRAWNNATASWGTTPFAVAASSHIIERAILTPCRDVYPPPSCLCQSTMRNAYESPWTL
jgi:hypothetical protein